MKWTKNCQFLLFLFLTPGMVSCQHKFTGEAAESLRDDQILGARRPSSMRIWEGKRIRGIPAADYSGLATAILLPPQAKVQWRPGSRDGSTPNSFRASGKDLSCGSAVPLTADGYFLTAAHNTNDFKHVQVGACSGDQTFTLTTARVVWKSAAMGGGGDFAVLHAPMGTFLPLQISDPDSLQVGMPVLCSGWSGRSPEPAGGKILSLSKEIPDESGASWRWIGHSAPILGGDSGGPVIGVSGELLGITTSIHYRLILPFGLNRHWRYQGIAVAPHPNWLRKVIGMDRQSRNP